jgi:hypothetical protein
VDDRRFDALAKTLSTGRTRRALVQLLAALPLAGSLAMVLQPPTAGAERPLDRLRDRAKRKQEKRQNRRDKNDNDKNDNNGNKGKGGKGGKGGNPCRGQADGTCCAGANGKKWCQNGACRAVPATRSIADCQGFCAGPPDFPGIITVCGQTVQCPPCTDCACVSPGGGPNTCSGTGAHGPGGYCTQGDSLGSCDAGQCPGNQVCCTSNCESPCTS